MKVTAQPTLRTFKITSDPDGEMEVTVRQATFGDDSAREAIFTRSRFIFNDDRKGQVAQEQDWNPKELQAEEIYLTLAGCAGIVDEEGKPYFEFNTTTQPVRPRNKTEFLKRLQALPSEVVEEIHHYVRTVNKQWDQARSGE